MEAITVRPFRSGDVEELRGIYLQLYDERDSGDPVWMTLFTVRPGRDDETTWYERQHQRALDGDLIYLVAEVGGKVVGSCSVGRAGPTKTSEDAHVGELGILVLREMRGKGVGSALLERAISEARSWFDVVYLSVFSQNARARELYERFGFTVCGHLPRVMKRGDRYFDADRMVLVFPDRPGATGENR